MNTPKVQRKTPGELILERHLIHDKNNTLKVPCESKPTIVRIPDNVTQQEITYLEPLIRKSIRLQSLISCPSFKDICKDISSDIKAEDDLNAGDLRRRASLILEQEAQIIAQITQMRRPSADVTVDEAISEEPAAEESETKVATESKDIVLASAEPKIDEKKPSDAKNVENVIVIKKKTKKKGSKLKHKITVTVEVENPTSPPLKVDVSTSPDVPASGTKSSPTWRAVVEEIKEDVTLNLPKRNQKDEQPVQEPATTVAATENDDDDFWHLIGRRDSIYYKKKVDLKRNEIEIIEILDNDGAEQVAENGAKKPIESGSNASPQIEKKSNGKTPTDINIKEKGHSQENIGNKVQLQKNLKKNDDNSSSSSDSNKTVTAKATTKAIKTSKPIAIAAEKAIATVEPAVEKQSSKCENALGNKEMIAKPMEIKAMENDGSVENPPHICPVNVVENVTATTTAGSGGDDGSITNKTPCHEHKQTDKNDAKSPTMMQTGENLNLETGPKANKAAPLSTAAVAIKTDTETEKLEKPKQKQIISKTVSRSESLEKTDSDRSVSKAAKTPAKLINDSNVEKNTTEKAKPKKVLKKAAKSTDDDASVAPAIDGDTSTTVAAAKPKPKKKLVKKAAKSGKELKKLKSVSSIESEINATESTDADTSATSESIAMTETIEPKLSDRGNDNESKLNLVAGATKTPDANAKPCDYERGAVDGDTNGVGGLSKFATVANLNADFEIDRQSTSNDRIADRICNEISTFSTRSIADSCISGDETFDLILNFDSDSEKFSDSESEDEMGQKRRPKKRKEKIDTRKVMKLDPKRKCYITDEAAKYPLIATPRPLAKRSNYCGNYAESESESETSSDICSSDECYDECLSPNDVVVKDVIRMSTCSNDSGFEGGGTAPSSPKKALGKQHHTITI